MHHYRELGKLKQNDGTFKLKSSTFMYRWLHNQSYNARIGKLSKERTQLLRDIGVNFEKVRSKKTRTPRSRDGSDSGSDQSGSSDEDSGGSSSDGFSSSSSGSDSSSEDSDSETSGEFINVVCTPLIHASHLDIYVKNV